MKVLFPLDVPSFNPGNPYVLQLMESLIQQREISVVSSGGAALSWPKPAWDIIHIQWPESLIGWQTPTRDRLDALNLTLRQAKRHASIVVTVHNYAPKQSMGPIGHELYRTVYDTADAFVHLGQRSVDWFLTHHSDYAGRLHDVINHGDYRFYETIGASEPLVPPTSDTTDFLVF
jgi:hypothetical protein